MTKILIIGADSFVGKNFFQYSKFKDIEEISLFNTKPENIDFGKFDVVIHLVAIVHQTRRIPEAKYFLINKDLCLEVAKFAKEAHIKQFIFLSSVKVYGKFIPGSEPWDESSECHPDDSYGRSKYEAEKALQQLDSQEFIVSIIRTPLVYGEGVKANMSSIMKLVDASGILPFKAISNRRNFTAAENLVGFIDRIIEKRVSGVFLAMDGTAISTTELVKMISENLGKKVFLFKVPDIFIRIGMYLYPRFFDRLYGSFEMDNSKTLAILNYKPPVSTGDSIKKMVEFFKRNSKNPQSSSF